jgi:hypothetical protein
MELKATQIATCTWELEQKQNQDELLVNLTVPTNNTNTQTQTNPFFYSTDTLTHTHTQSGGFQMRKIRVCVIWGNRVYGVSDPGRSVGPVPARNWRIRRIGDRCGEYK